jgi:hypothetical protein
MSNYLLRGLEGLRERRQNKTSEIEEYQKSETASRKKSYKVYSKILDAYLWVVATDVEMRKMLDEGIEEPIYTYDDVVKLDGISKEELRVIHKFKRIFPGSTVEDIKHENGRTNT